MITNRSCFDGYLTDHCKDCRDWSDGSNGKSLGCNSCYPIDFCPYFVDKVQEEMHQEKEEE